MGRRGPPPQPTRLQVLKGNPGKRKVKRAEPKPRALPPEMPDMLSERAQEVWKETLAELERMDLVTIVDGPTLAAYCQAVAEIEECDRALAEKGMTYVTPTGFIRPRPEVQIRQMAFQRMIAAAGRFGLTPSDRTRFNVPTVDPSDDEFGEFLSRGRKA